MDEVDNSNKEFDIPAQGHFELKGSQLKELFEAIHNCAASKLDGEAIERISMKKRNAKSVQIQCVSCGLEAELPIGNEKET